MGTFFGGKSPGTVVPSSEQKQSGRTQTDGSHGGARLGSVSLSGINNQGLFNFLSLFGAPLKINLVQHFFSRA